MPACPAENRSSILLWGAKLKDVMFEIKEEKFETLELAMNHAKTLNEFVVIKGDNVEIVGMFGADTIKDGKCPDGVEYSWMKRGNQWSENLKN